MFDYMAAGLPIVSNVHGEIADLIERAGAGITAREQSPDGLAAACDVMVAQGASAWAPQPQGRHYLEKHANRRAMVATLIDQIEAL
jgi:hypothetical protein